MTKSEWANNLLGDEKFLEVFKDLKDSQLARFANSNEFDYDERQAAYVKLNALNDIINHIQSMADQRIINEKRFKIF